MTFAFNEMNSYSVRRPAFPAVVPALRRAHGALRYRCPSTGSYVLLTDPAALAEATRPGTATYCPGCGATHLLTQDAPRSEIVRPRTAA